jgi:hypothetical protein
VDTTSSTQPILPGADAAPARFPPSPSSAPDPSLPPASAHAHPPAPSPAPPAPPPPPARPLTRTHQWLGAGDATGWLDEGRRLVLAAALASIFGVAIGLRRGGTAIALAAAGAPAGIVAVAAVAVPAFAIVLALANAPLDMKALARATARAAMRAGMFLAGVAPGMALLAVTCEEAISVSVFALGGLLFAGAVAGSAFAADLRAAIASMPRGRRVVLSLAVPAFLAFAAVLAARVWWLALPMLTEAS